MTDFRNKYLVFISMFTRIQDLENTGWKEYANKDRGFEIKFPKELGHTDWGRGITTFENLSQTEKKDFGLIITYTNFLKKIGITSI